MRPANAAWCAKPMDFLSLGSGRILVEQLRLVQTNLPVSNLATGAASLILLWVLSQTSPQTSLLIWVGLVWLGIGFSLWLSVRFLQSSKPLEQALWTVRVTVIFYAFYGMLWGALPWLALDSAGPWGTALIVCMSAGIVAGATAFMSPVLPVFVCFSSLLALSLAARLLTLDEPVHIALGLGAIIFYLTLLSQARKASQAFFSMITLRFENASLVERLQQEHARAQVAQGQAEEANMAKSKFLAAASHDLRQPVHAQGLFLEVLGGTDLTQEQREVLASARAACTASSDMLNTLLDFSRIEAGVVRPHTQPFLLQPLLNKLEVEQAVQANAKGLVYRARETQAQVFSDPALVELILRNLVSNAIRYTEQGGILVGCRQRANGLSIEVWDTGVGIAPAHQKEVFREFHQLANPERDRRKGLGLGLAIADGLARTLGHRLSLASTLHRGSVFRLELPISHAPVPELPLATQGMKVSLQGLRVLVVDDDVAVRSGMSQLLRNWGCACDTAEWIEDALALARQHRPDVVICDYRLRERRTGLEAIKALRGLLGEDLPVLLVTGDTDPVRLREAMASGVPLLHKPVAPDLLHQALVDALAISPAFVTLVT